MRLSLAIALLAACLVGIPAEAASKPNFVFFLVDDLGWTDLGCCGSTFYETSNVDRLAATGMRFTNAYASSPVCSPTRASILTGKYPNRVRVTMAVSPTGKYSPENWRRRTLMLPASMRDRLFLEEVTVAEALKQAGYATFFAGKWHLGPRGFWPENQGFDINRGGHHAGGPFWGKHYFSPYGNPCLKDGPDGEHLPARLATETVKFIEEHRDDPFLAYLSFYSVHTPLMARQDLREKYQSKRESVAHDGPRWGKERQRKVRLIHDHAVYAGMVEAMDQAVGRVLDALDRLGLAENTIVIFTSDNGGLSTSEGHPTSNLPLRAGKGWLYEGGIREPMIVRWPGVTQPNSVCDAAVISMDFYPTILEMAGLAPRPGQHVDGRSIAPLLRGERREQRPLFWHFPHYANQGGAPAAAVRDGDWKLIEWYEDGSLELFNLSDDPGEKNNLAEVKPEVRNSLHRKLDAWRKSVDVWMPTHRALDDPLRPKGR
ncbi:MAG: sulfatase [Pirellulales bacterium]|nr:sulfatase [Pirellulales bacterium]